METLKRHLRRLWKNLPWKKIKKVLVGAVIAMLGALLTYLSEVVTTVNWGEWTPIVTALFAIFVNMARKAIGI